MRAKLPKQPALASASYLLYVLRCADGSLYTGITNNLEKRLRAHLAKKGSRYVAARLPAELVYREGPFASKGDALRREHAIKRLTRTAKESLILTALGKPQTIA